MRCHYAFQAEFIVTLIAFILAISLVVLRTAEARLFSGFLILLVSIIIIVLPQPWAIGICPHGGACAKTAFFTTIIGSLLGVIGAVIVWIVRKGQEEYQSRQIITSSNTI